MPQLSERRGRIDPAQAEEILKTAVAFFIKLQRDKKWTYEELHEIYFIKHFDLGTLKTYLGAQRPKRPRDATVAGFAKALRQAKAEQNESYQLYRAILSGLGHTDLTSNEIEHYKGEYRFWRLSRKGLIEGRVEVLLHPVAGIPFYKHVHDQAVDPAGEHIQTFSYEGGIYWLAQNVCFLSISGGEFRITLFRCVPDPRTEPLVGMFLSEERDGNRNPFGGKIIMCHEAWYAANQSTVTGKWLRSMLKNGVPLGAEGSQDMLRM